MHWNRIAEVRAQIEGAFDAALIIAGSHESLRSPCGKYAIDLDVYQANDTSNWRITKAVVRLCETGGVIAQFKRNDESFFHCWLDHGGTQYLLCSEDLEGQTCIDLTHRRIESYSSEDSFIWTEFYPSPSKRKIAIVGCYWACPYVVKIYDFSEPMNLPLTQLKEIAIPSGNSNFGQWLSEDAFTFVGNNGTSEVCEGA